MHDPIALTCFQMYNDIPHQIHVVLATFISPLTFHVEKESRLRCHDEHHHTSIIKDCPP